MFFIAFGQKVLMAQIGNDPPSIKWKQINTPLSRVIFPEGMDSVATRITNVIHFINGTTSATIGNKTKKIDIVLKNQTTVSNGFVDLAPFKSEFYTTPHPNSFELGSVPWPDLLAIHEYRHVQQFNNFDVGLTKFFHTLFGQEAQSLMSSTAIPNWFFEGDAVYNETNLSKQGRGSLPFFHNNFRAIWMEEKNYSWMKLRNGSLKDDVPNHYQLGYLLVAYGREKYGEKFWENVTHDAASFKNIFYPFQQSLKKYAGVDFETFRNDAFNYYKNIFQTENILPKEVNKNEDYLNERYPSFTENGEIIFIKNSFKHTADFIKKNGAEEMKIRTVDNTIDPYYSYRNGKIVYTSFRPDIRWGDRNYSEIAVLDVTNGHQHTITKRSKYFSPDISEDGQMVVAVNVPEQGGSTLHLLNAANGELINEIKNREHLFYTYPKFYDREKIISPVRNSEGKMSIALINFEKNTTEYLLPFTFNVIAFPAVWNDTLYFSSSYKDNDELMAYTFSNKKIWKINTKEKFGLGKYHPSVNDSNIIWHRFTAEGNRLQKVNKEEISFKEVSFEEMNANPSHFGISSLDNSTANLLRSIPNDTFSITDYSKVAHLFYFHSLQATIDDPLYSVDWVSNNVLNTLESKISFKYNSSDQSKTVGASATYGGFFPLLTGGISYSFDRKGNFKGNAFLYSQWQPYIGFSIPLNLSKGRSFTSLNFGSNLIYNQTDIKGMYKDSIFSPSFNYLNNFISFRHQIQKSQQEIFPRFSQSINLIYKTPLYQYHGYQFMVNSDFYFPGFMSTHSIALKGAFSKKDNLQEINFSNDFPFSRGYLGYNFYKMFKWGVNYHLPLFYPDKGFADIAYLLRVRANVFFDDTEVQDFLSNGSEWKNSFRSVGSEITFDTKWWNQVNVSFGFRYSYLLDSDMFGNSGRNRWEIILPVNIFNR